MADGMGNLIGWEETGLVEGKQWITAKDDKVSDVCNANGGMGVIGLHEPFSHGALTIPEHPNGRCAVVPVVGRTGKLAKGSRAMETGDGRQVRLFPYRAANWGNLLKQRSFVKRLCSMRVITLSAKTMSMKAAGMN
ncbi:hypothetical protein C4H36_05565 [Neisseria gonorrhoeae]